MDGVTVLEEDVTVLDEGVTTLEDDSATVLGDALKDGVTVQECEDKTIMLVSILPLVFCFYLALHLHLYTKQSTVLTCNIMLPSTLCSLL